MKELMSLVGILAISIIVIIAWINIYSMLKRTDTKSELHARDRYAVAEEIDREMKKKQRPAVSGHWDRKQKRKYSIVI